MFSVSHLWKDASHVFCFLFPSLFRGQVNYIVDINVMDSVNFEVLVLSLCLLECNTVADFSRIGCRVVDRHSTV